MGSTVLFEQSDGVAHISFNRGDRHNALGKDELAGIENALASLNQDTRVLVIGSEGGRTFCAGADLSQITSGELTGDRFQAVTNQIANLPIPTLCVINGNVFGGGVELAISCDFRIGAEDIMMRIPAAAIGLCYPIDGIERLVSRLGVGTAKRLLVAAEELTASDMKALGILNWILPPSALVEGAMDVARQLAGLAPLSVRSMLKVISQIERRELDRVEAAQLSEMCANSKDLQEGLAAQRERRKPEFKGH